MGTIIHMGIHLVYAKKDYIAESGTTTVAQEHAVGGNPETVIIFLKIFLLI